MNTPRQTTQKAKVLNFLKRGNSITPIEALHNFGVFRLSAIVFTLRGEGYDIKTTMVSNGYGAKYASYRIKQLALPF
jgi:hypothetical protein